jgi:hypothetical protein
MILNVIYDLRNKVTEGAYRENDDRHKSALWFRALVRGVKFQSFRFWRISANLSQFLVTVDYAAFYCIVLDITSFTLLCVSC